MSALLDLALQAAGPLATALLAYVARVARRLDRRLDDVDRNTRAIYGDSSVGWPGLMDVVDDDDDGVLRADGGESRSE